MPAGLQVWGDSGFLQIDGESPMVTLLRKGSVVTGPYQGGLDTSPTLASIPLNPGEILALRPQAGAWVTLWGRTGNTAIIMMTAPFQTCEYWIFSEHQPSGLPYGMEVYSNSGRLIYDTGRPVMNILGSHDGTGGPGYFNASGVAVIPWQQYCHMRRFVEYVEIGPNARFMTFMIATMGVISVSGNGVTTQNTVVASVGNGPYDPGTVIPSNWVYEGDNGMDNRWVVIATDNL